MTFTQVVEVKGRKGKVRSPEAFKELVHRARDEVRTVSTQDEGPCEEACAESGGVDSCGETYVVCNNGDAFLIDP